MHAVTLRHIGKSFGSTTILKSLSLDIEAGDFTVLLGSSGCGKSTLLSLIAGLDDVSEGSIHFGDRDVTDLPPKDRDIAMVFQSYALYPTMSVRNNMAFGLRMTGVPKSEIDERIEWAAKLLRLEDYLDRKPGQLSGGQRQRVAIGRAIVRKAKVYLFDEPLSNLDAKLRAEMRLEIKRLHQALGATMIYVTHDQVEAMTMATKVALMRNGQVEQYGPPEEIYNTPQTRYVAEFVGSPAINMLEAAIVASPTGAKVALPGCDAELAAPAGANPQNVILGVRPEHLYLNASTHPRLQSQALVEVVEFTGADAVVWVRAQAGRLCIRVASGDAPRANTHVDVFVDISAIAIFDTQDGHRL